MTNESEIISKKLLITNDDIKKYLDYLLKKLEDTNLNIDNIFKVRHHLSNIYKQQNPLLFDPESLEILFNCYTDFDVFFDNYINLYNFITDIELIKKINSKSIDIDNLCINLRIYQELYNIINTTLELIQYSKKLIKLRNINLVKTYLIKNTSIIKNDINKYLVNKYILNLLCTDSYQLANDEEKLIQYQKVLLIILNKLDFTKQVNTFLVNVSNLNISNIENECIEHKPNFFDKKIKELDEYLKTKEKV